MSATTCKEALDDDDEGDEVSYLKPSDFGGSGGADPEPETAPVASEEDEDGDQENGSGEWCNAEIVHIRSLPDVWDPEWPTETKRRLRERYEEYMGTPPPIG